MIDTIKENPVPSIIAGLSIGWLATQGAKSSSRRQAVDSHSYDPTYEADHRHARTQGYAGDVDYTREGHRDESERHSVRERAGEATGRAQETARQYGHQAQETAAQYGRQAQETAQRSGRQARRRARQTTSQMERTMKENPLAVGAATLAAGAFFGFMLPSTRKEDELMGEARDQTVQKARSTAQETAAKARNVAEKTAEKARETAEEELQQQKSRNQEQQTEKP